MALHPSGARAARLAGGAGTHTALHSGGARAAQNAGGLAAGGESHAAWLCTRTELAHLGILAGWRPEEPRGSAAGNRSPVVRRLDVFLVLIVAIADYQSPYHQRIRYSDGSSSFKCERCILIITKNIVM